VIAGNPELGRSAVWRRINKALWSGVPEIYRRTYTYRPNSVPDLLKIDMIETDDDSLMIAEVDGYNERGLGYGILCNRLRAAVAPDARVLPGAGVRLQEAISSQTNRDVVLLLYANRERFYRQEFQIIADEMRRFDIKVIVAAEEEVTYKEGAFWVSVNGVKSKRVETDLLFYHPVMYHDHRLSNVLAELYLDGRVKYLIPPKPFYGSKAVLALLRNDEADGELEAILRSQMSLRSLEIVRSHIPPTYLITKSWRDSEPACGFVLKRTMSSGMKGTFFQDDPDFEKEMAAARKAECSYVLQREVNSSIRPFRYYSGEDQLVTEMCRNRLTVHYIGRRLAEAAITALPGKAVHGAVDSMLIGTVIGNTR
jgi:hypothetical protein